jgi:hypothetical protein
MKMEESGVEASGEAVAVGQLCGVTSVTLYLVTLTDLAFGI